MTRSSRAFAVGALLLGICLGLTASASAAPAPFWRVSSATYPTNLPPGGEGAINLVVANTGNGSSAGAVTVVDTLPAGITATSAGDGYLWQCSGTSVVTCTNDPVNNPSIAPTLAADSIIPISVSVDPSAVGNGMSSVEISGGGAVGSPPTRFEIPVGAQRAGFGLVPDSLFADSFAENGTVDTQAGGHPFAAATEFALDTAMGPGAFFGTGPYPDQRLKDVVANLPLGFVGNPQAAPTCQRSDFNRIAGDPTACPAAAQVGSALVTISALRGGQPFLGTPVPIFNLPPRKGEAAAFGFVVAGVSVTLSAKVRSDDYGVSVTVSNVSEGLLLFAQRLRLWGVPAASSHDSERLCEDGTARCSYSLPTPRRALLTSPTSCTGPQSTGFELDSWQAPSDFKRYTAKTKLGLSGCERLPFDPSVTVKPTTGAADSPSGLNVDVHIPQGTLEDPGALAQAHLKKAVISLPRGISVNPASASGLGSCSAVQVDLRGPDPAACPDSSKLGSVEIDTPLLDHPVKGGIYLAQQKANPFGSLLALYLAIDDPQTGTVIKLPGKIESDAGSGQVTATFDQNPQLPFEDLQVEFFGGPRASLITPPSCGTYTTEASFTPWSGTPPVSSNSPFQITSGPNGQPCPKGGFDPKLSAGTTNPVAGDYSPFVLKLSREDGTQRLSTITAKLPKGLVGKLKGIPYCPDSALAGIPTAEGTGAGQLVSPSCPAASQVGTVSVGAGAGPSPFYVNTGKAYLAGPYKSAPLSLAIVTPALAGPFDLGNVLVRTALRVDPETAQITAVSDPLPTILHGIPLDLRDVRVSVDRDGFTLNPTSCDPMKVASTITGVGGASASPSDRFQVGSCERLGFQPKLSLSVKGGTKRHDFPKFKAVLSASKGEANIGKVSVKLPHSEFLEQGHIGTVCTRPQFAAEQCPAKSIYGYAKAWTPLLDRPLEGPVYLRANGGERELPDLVAALHGQIDVDLAGYIDSVHGQIRNRFNLVPDAPVSRFVLEMKGGKKGLLVNSANLCRSTNRATVKMDGQNGKVDDFSPVLRNSCGGKPKK
jgi:hypothetical protein